MWTFVIMCGVLAWPIAIVVWIVYFANDALKGYFARKRVERMMEESRKSWNETCDYYNNTFYGGREVFKKRLK